MKSILALCLVFLAISAVHSANLIQTAENAGLTTLVSLINTADLDGALNGTGPFTVFAPTNDAFAALGNNAPSGDALEWTLLYHVISGAKVLASAVTDNAYAKTMNNTNLILNKKSSSVYVNGIEVALADVDADNGVAHVIGTVLSIPTGNISTVAAGASKFSTLVNLLSAANLVSTLETIEGPVTVFAPNNAAFAKVPGYILDYLGSNVTALTEVLTYHVLAPSAGAVYSSFIDLFDGQQVATLEGRSVSVALQGSEVRVGGAIVVTPNILAGNGVIHEIDAVMLPPGIVLPAAPSSASMVSLSLALIFAAIAIVAVAL